MSETRGTDELAAKIQVAGWWPAENWIQKLEGIDVETGQLAENRRRGRDLYQTVERTKKKKKNNNLDLTALLQQG